MRKTNCETDVTSPWRRCQEAQAYFGIGRNTLDKLAAEAEAKKKIGRVAFYNIRAIEGYINKAGAI